MEISITLPDDIARQMATRWGDLPRRILETVASDAYRDGTIGALQLQQILGLRSRLEVDAFLAKAGIHLDYTAEDLDADIRALDELLGT